MALLQDQDRQVLTEEFAKLDHPVDMILFKQNEDCQYCPETQQIAEEVSALSDKITLKIYDFEADAQKAADLNIDKTPALALLKGGPESVDYGIRYFGIPSGYEFSTLVEGIKMVSRGDSGLSADTRTQLEKLDKPLHLQVFITPTCPHCPRAVHLAHQMAFESPWVRGDMVEAVEFPQLSMKYEVRGVPRTVINETVFLEGAAPEAMVMSKVQEAM